MGRGGAIFKFVLNFTTCSTCSTLLRHVQPRGNRQYNRQHNKQFNTQQMFMVTSRIAHGSHGPQGPWDHKTTSLHKCEKMPPTPPPKPNQAHPLACYYNIRHRAFRHEKRVRIFDIFSNFCLRPLGPLGPWSKAPGAPGTNS